MSHTQIGLRAISWKWFLSGTILILFTALQLSGAQTLTTLYSFAGPRSDGFHPDGSLVLDSQGSFYGTTEGGVGGCKRARLDCGTIFKVDSNGVETTLHSFATGANAHPMSGLIADSKGNFYGTTRGTGGATQLDGTVFRLTKQKNSKALHVFRNNQIQPGDGAFPVSAVVMDSQGNLYGTTENGGTYGLGTVYKVSASGTETILHSFGGSQGDGVNPASPLLLSAQGNLYGTTLDHVGVGCSPCGTVFEITPSGVETVLYTFAGGSDGTTPFGGLIADSQGDLYGTTTAGGGASGNCSLGCGTVFKLTPSGAESVLYRFTGVPDGAVPMAALVMDAQGNLFGTTHGGGNSTNCGFAPDGCGTVFELTSAGSESVLYTFCSEAGCPDGAHPASPLLLDQSGNLYGTASGGGISNCGNEGWDNEGCGTLFKLTP